MNIHLVWNNWIPQGSPYELCELLGLYDDYHKAQARMTELAIANGVEYELGHDIFHVDHLHCEANYYYVESRHVE